MTRRTVRIRFRSRAAARRAQSVLSDVAEGHLRTDPVPILTLTVDSWGMQEVRQMVDRLDGHVVRIR